MGRYRTPISWSTIYNSVIGWNMNSLSVRAKVFGEMVKIANPLRMAAHVSDLYYDALFLADKFQTEQGTWTEGHIYFGCSDTHTQVEDVHFTRILEHSDDAYKLIVKRQNLGHRGPAEWEYTLIIKRAEQN